MQSSSIFLLLSLVASAAFAQNIEPQESFTVHVNLVEVPVNVVDRSGKPVRGLKPENFELYDDGEKRPISHFQEIDVAKISTDEPSYVTAAARRNFLIVFDLTNSHPSSILRAREAAKAFVMDGLAERDLAAVATYSVEEGFRILTAFTTDRHLVGEAIRTLGIPRFFQTRDPLLLSGITPVGVMPPDRPQFGTEFDTEVREVAELIRQRVERSNDQYYRARIENQLRTFGEMARFLDKVRGRKQVVLLSEGFEARLIHGREVLNTPETEGENLAVLRGEVWRIDNDERFGNAATIGELDSMARLFDRSDVVLHAIDIRGVRTASDARTGSQAQSSESLFLMADSTGGKLFKNSNDLAVSFARMLKQQEVVYILGFQSRAVGHPGKFHDLRVKVKVVGYPGLRASHRMGYYEPRTQMSAIEQRLSATDILMNDIPYEDVSVSVLAAPFPSAEANAQVPVVVEIGGETLLDRVSGNTVNGEIFIYAFDKSGTVKDFLFQTFSVELPKLRQMIRTSGIKYYGSLSLPPGDYDIKTLVRVVESGENGFKRLHLYVPASGEAALLPPLFLEEPGRWVLLRGASKAGSSAEYPFVVAEESFIPSARPRFKPGVVPKFAIFAYNVAAEEIELSAILTSPDGAPQNARLKLLGRTSMDRQGAVKLLLELDATGLKPGAYKLDLTMRKRDGPGVGDVSVPFDVESSAAASSSRTQS